jgi:hypothetical protein
MSNNHMRQHRENMLAQKKLRQSQSLDPWAKVGRAKLGGGQATAHVGVDLAAGSDSTAEVAVSLANALDSGEPPMYELDPTRQIELRFWSHLQQLKDYKSQQTKVAMKAEFLPEYEGYIDGCLACSPAEQNDVLVTLMVWALDCEQFALATRIARYAVLNDMVMPDGWERSIAEVVTENAAEAFIANPNLAASQHEVIQDIIDLGRGEDFHDKLRAKIFKAQGIALREYKPVEAIEAFNQALKLDSNCGVRNFIKDIERTMKGGTATESTLDASGSQGVASDADSSAAADTTNPETTAPTPDA